MKHFLLQAVVIIMTAFFNVLQAQQLTGIVMSEDAVPIEDVIVLMNGKFVATTNAEGVFVLSEALTLPLSLSFQHPEYDSEPLLFLHKNQQFILRKSLDMESLDPIVLLGLNENDAKIITPTALLKSEALEQQSPVDVVASINQVPGIYIQNGAINTNRIVIRGVGSRTLYGSNKIRAYFDEIPITNGVGETEIDSYNPEDLQSIELIKGPKATAYGTSLGGTLLLNSKSPEQRGISLKNSTTVGSFGLFKNSLTTTYANSNFHLHLNYDHLEVDGFRQNSHYNRNALRLQTTYAFNKKTTLTFLMNHVDYTAQIASSIGTTDFEEDPSQAAFTWKNAKGYETDASLLTGLSLTHQFSETFKNTTSIFYSYNDHYEPRPFNILDEFTNRFGLRTVFTKTFKIFDRTADWATGAELNKDEYHWKTIQNLYALNNGTGSLEGMILSDNEEFRNQLNVFSTITLPIDDKITMEFGANYNRTTYEFQDEFSAEDNNQSATRKFDAILAPNLNVLYQFNGNKNVFANVSYGFNHPTLEETLTPDGMINPDIGPEQGFNYEIGTELYFFNRKWHVLTSLYLLNIKDLLVAQRVGDDQYIGRNAGQTIHKGLEISTDYSLQIDGNVAIVPYLNVSYTDHRFKEFISEDTDFSGNKLTGVPDLTLASGIAFRFNNLFLYGNYLYVGEMPMNDANTIYSDAYNLLNMKLTYLLQPLKDVDVRLNFGVNNVLDKDYASAILINATGFNNSEPRYYYPGNPRNYYGGISARYHF